MKVLWLVNSIMPELSVHLGGKPSVFGGWLIGAMNAVRKTGAEMVICTAIPNSSQAGRYELPGVVYYICTYHEQSELRNEFQTILDREQPDLVHIFGTEYEAAYCMVQVSNPSRTVLTLQGALQYIWKTCCDGIPEKVLGSTILHLIRRRVGMGGKNLKHRQEDLRQRALLEKQIIEKIRYADGCSQWGSAYIAGSNPKCKVFQCGCFLRDPFYEEPRWNADQCKPYTVFALMTRPEKGAHMLIEAMRYIVMKYPEAKLIIAGDYFSYREYSGLKRWIQDLTPDYYWYIQQLVDRYHLRNNICFLGNLNAEQMKQQMLSANVFVSPSSHEHLATALGEARLTGTPSVATAVGAIPEMIDHGEDGYLYHFYETHVLAQYICNLFENKDLANQFSVKGREHALRTYSPERCSKSLIAMYHTILEQ